MIGWIADAPGVEANCSSKSADYAWASTVCPSAAPLETLLAAAKPPRPEDLSPTAQTAMALVAADLNGGLSAVEQARRLLAQLTEAECASLLAADQPRRAWPP